MNNLSPSEIKLKVLITAIEKRLDKNSKDYWIIRSQLNQINHNYLAFSTDYNLTSATLALLTNPTNLVNRRVILTLNQKADREKVIAIQIEK